MHRDHAHIETWKIGQALPETNHAHIEKEKFGQTAPETIQSQLHDHSPPGPT
jgi:hypothetical protein